MALRRIVVNEDPILRKVCKPVEVFDERLAMLLDDMKDTLLKAEGVGLAAPQVGFLKRIFIMNLGDVIFECINPKIIKQSGKQRVLEGCLSFPDKWGYVIRPAKVKLSAQDRNGRTFTLTLKELGAQCAAHEYDHLDGKPFIDKVVEFVDPEEVEQRR
ncbi:MAG: peptide deformylase [Clostridium sp.]|nr:peptide deformylase [Clostridium sp.]MCM1547291.1 peptide deformylase [Ruminococcus sp.]